ncbi:MAG: DUF2341 domain-containing protein [Candidatus Micrarchaeota archaeon]
MKTFKKSFIKKKLLGKASAKETFSESFIKAQSAMEYLMTYGWAILIVAVVLGALYSLGVFNGAAFLGTSCIAASGFYCINPTLSTGGVLTVTIGQATGTTFKNAYLYFVPSGTNFSTSDPSTSIGTLNSGQQVTASIPLGVGSPYPAAYTLGTPLSGYLYLQFTDIYGTTEVNKIATVLTKVTASSGVATFSQPTSIPSGIVAYVPITLTNSQSSATPSPFQQMIQINEGNYANYIAYNGNIANFEFYTQSGQILPAWIESNNSGTLTVWVKLPNGIPASSSLTIYLGFASKTTNLLSNSGTTGIGEASQLSLSYGQYDDIGSVMNSGLLYQIWGWGGSGMQPQSELYQATMSPSSSFTFGSTTATASSTLYTTPSPGTTQNVDGTNQNNVIINYQNSYSGGAPPPNPPVSNQNYWLVKAIGFISYTSGTTLYGIADDGIGLGYYNGAPCSFTSWLCGTSNPNNIINEWIAEGATTYSGTISSSGDYPIELDFENQGGPGYIGMWSSSTLNYYSPSYPPNGVMPSVSFGGLSTA